MRDVGQYSLCDVAELWAGGVPLVPDVCVKIKKNKGV